MEVYIIDNKIKTITSCIDKSMLIGFILILLGVVILFTNFIDSFVTTLFWPILEGSSEGKAVLFLGLLGSFCILSSFINKSDKIKRKLYKNNESHWHYLLYALILLLTCAIIGLIIEIYIRTKFNVSIFTILSTMDPNTSTTSLMHSHVYKSVLGFFSNSFVPTHVNTGSSILTYVLPYALVIAIIWPIIYLLGLSALSKMTPIYKAVTIFLISTSLIGLIDGGLFSQPFLIGFGFLLLVYAAHGNLIKNGRINIKPLINPFVIVGYILLAAIILEVGGSETTYHTLTVINQTEPVNMDEYNVISVYQNGDKTTYIMDTKTPDKVLIREIFQTFKGKASLTFMSWNFYSYF